MADPLPSALIVAAGAAVAGFAQGLTGFAFSVVALSFWAWALPPQTAAPLAVFGALAGQIASLASVRGGFEWTRIIPLIVGGWLGVPLGVFLLHHADPQNFRLAVGLLLTLYSLFALFLRHPARRTRTRRVFRAHRRRARRPWRHVRLCPGDLDAAARLEARPQARDDASLQQ